MRHFFLFITLIFCFGEGKNQNTLAGEKINPKPVLDGRIIGLNEGIIYLSYFSTIDNIFVEDSATIINGIFKFGILVNKPTVAYISLKKGVAFGKYSTNIFLEPSKQQIELRYNDFQFPRMSGSGTQVLFQMHRQNQAILLRAMDSLFDILSKAKGTTYMEISAKMDEKRYEFNQLEYGFFDKNPTSYVTAYLLRHHLRDLSKDSIKLFFSRLPAELQNDKVVEIVREKIKSKNKPQINDLIPDFSFGKIKNVVINKNNFIGRYYLINCWASWCIPCRLDNIILKKVFEKYKKKEFAIIAIADDVSFPKKWKAAIAKDKVEAWYHVLRSFKSDEGALPGVDIYDLLGVETIPEIFLINPDGVIIGRYNSANINELSPKLKSIYGY